MATYLAVDLTGEAEGGECPHNGYEQLAKTTGVKVADIRPVVGSKLTPTSELLFTVTEDNTLG